MKPTGEGQPGTRTLYWSPMPTGLFFVDAFPDLTADAILALQRHFFMAIQKYKAVTGKPGYVQTAWSVEYDAESRHVARHRNTARRLNAALIRAGYIECVRCNSGHAPTFRLTEKLKQRLYRNLQEMRADAEGRPRRHNPKAIMALVQRRQPGSGSSARKRGTVRKAENAQPELAVSPDPERAIPPDSQPPVPPEKKTPLITERVNSSLADAGGVPPAPPASRGKQLRIQIGFARQLFAEALKKLGADPIDWTETEAIDIHAWLEQERAPALHAVKAVQDVLSSSGVRTPREFLEIVFGKKPPAICRSEGTATSRKKGLGQ